MDKRCIHCLMVNAIGHDLLTKCLLSGRMKASRWEPVEPESPVAKSRWEKEESEDVEIPKSKWEREEDNEPASKWKTMDSNASKWQKVTDSPNDRFV